MVGYFARIKENMRIFDESAHMQCLSGSPFGWTMLVISGNGKPVVALIMAEIGKSFGLSFS